MLDYSDISYENPKIRHLRLPPPPGFENSSPSSSTGRRLPGSQTTSSSLSEKQAKYESLKQKRAWDLSVAPAKSLPMQAFMLYMSGGGVQVFSMGIVFMLLSTPFKNVFSMNKAFSPFAPTSSTNSQSLAALLLQKVVYILCNMLTLALGLWKCNSMGLFPTGTGDWLAFETRGAVPDIVLY